MTEWRAARAAARRAAAHDVARRWLAWLAFVVSVLGAAPAWANVLEAPIGGAAIPVGPGRVACSAVGDWTLEAGGVRVRPPTNDAAVGSSVQVRVAPALSACPQSKEEITLLTTGRFPVLEPASVTLYVDEARVEAKGHNLKGAQLHWLAGAKNGVDACFEPKGDPAQQACAWVVGRELSADPGADTLRLLPAFAQLGEGRLLFDAQGQAVAAGGVPLAPAHIVLSKLLAIEDAVDLSVGRSELQLVHPEAVVGADCGALDCALVDKKLVVSSTAPVSSAELHLRLAPRVVLQRRGAQEATPSFKLPVLHCAMTVASGPPVRGNEGAKLVVKLESRCLDAHAAYAFFAGQAPLRTLEQLQTQDGLYVVLALGSYDREQLELSARRTDTNAIVATLLTPTRSVPTLRASLELPVSPRLDFVPTNRVAFVKVSRLEPNERWELISIPNVYVAGHAGARATIVGDPDAEGFTQLHFGLRSDVLPAELRQVDLAIVTDPLQRKIEEANVPVPLGASLAGGPSLIEFKCGPSGKTVALQPGDPKNLPFSFRDSCRITVHRERLRPENGHQRISLTVDVYSADGASRAEGHVKDTLEVSPGPEPRQIWIQGVTTPFDRVVVRVAHDSGENHYVRGTELYSSGPAVQWSVILGTGHARIYATSTIPAGLYRFGDHDHTGLLSLNFGVISRLTWLSNDGKEGLIGLEGGVMVIGLAGSTSSTGRSLTEVGLPVGLGLSVPIANRLSTSEASINLHGWVEFPLSRDDHRPAFIFGPSISIGNVGSNL